MSGPLSDVRRWWPKLARYAGVSVVGVAITQLLLAACLGWLSWGPVLANTAATVLAALPIFQMNRRLVWGRRGQHSLRTEIIPFWSYTLLGLLVSAGFVALADAAWKSNVAVMMANLVAWGVLWFGKFLLLERYLFADRASPTSARR
ncbi:MAG: GtrA family protein [Acidimicrobiales bacterium]|nr:GtrA family protein [Acidimicrobiales bacterium]